MLDWEFFQISTLVFEEMSEYLSSNIQKCSSNFDKAVARDMSVVFFKLLSVLTFMGMSYCNDSKFSYSQVWANCVDPDQTAPLTVRSRSTKFAIPSSSFGHISLW